MKLLPDTSRPSLLTCVFTLAVVLCQGHTRCEAAVTAGGIAIIGYTDNRNSDPLSDTFSIATLEAITANTVIYFTDNGWNDTNNAFAGANNSNGAGNEGIIKLTFSSSVAAGTILRAGTNGSGYSWDTTSTILNGSGDEIGGFGLLNLNHTGVGDQIYAFEAPLAAPLFNPTNHIYVLDLGDYSSPEFEDAVSSGTGNIPPGLSQDLANLTGNANTAFILPDPENGDDDNDFHNGSFALNMSSSIIAALNSTGGTKEQWLAAIADDSNWMRTNFTGVDVDAESQLSTLNILGVPEPSRTLLLGVALFGVVLSRRRR